MLDQCFMQFSIFVGHDDSLQNDYKRLKHLKLDTTTFLPYRTKGNIEPQIPTMSWPQSMIYGKGCYPSMDYISLYDLPALFDFILTAPSVDLSLPFLYVIYDMEHVASHITKLTFNLEECKHPPKIELIPKCENLKDLSIIPHHTIDADTYKHFISKFCDSSPINRLSTTHYINTIDTVSAIEVIHHKIQTCELNIVTSFVNRQEFRTFPYTKAHHLPSVTHFRFSITSSHHDYQILKSLTHCLKMPNIKSLSILNAPFADVINSSIGFRGTQNITYLEVGSLDVHESLAFLQNLHMIPNVKKLSIKCLFDTTEMISKDEDKEILAKIITEFWRISYISKNIFSDDIAYNIERESSGLEPESNDMMEETLNSSFESDIVAGLVHSPRKKLMSMCTDFSIPPAEYITPDSILDSILIMFCFYEVLYEEILKLLKVQYLYLVDIPNGFDSPRLNVLAQNHPSLKQVAFKEKFNRNGISVRPRNHYLQKFQVPYYFQHPANSGFLLNMHIYDAEAERQHYEKSLIRNPNLENCLTGNVYEGFRDFNYYFEFRQLFGLESTYDSITGWK